MKFPLRVLLLLLCYICGGIAVADDVPIAPISVEKHDLWGDIYTLESKQLRVIISAQQGVVTSIHHRISGEWLQSPLEVKVTKELIPPEWSSTVWESRAWQTSEGRQVAMLSRSLGPPLSIRIVKLIELDTDGTTFSQRTRITGTGPGDHRLLHPLVKTGLSPATEITGDLPELSLRYGDIITTWQCDWKIEIPETPLESLVTLEERSNEYIFSSRPIAGYGLPPQGWTILCTLKMKWETLDVEFLSK